MMTIRIMFVSAAVVLGAVLPLPVAQAQVQCTGRNCLPAPANPVDSCTGPNCMPPAGQPRTDCKGRNCAPIPETPQAPETVAVPETPPPPRQGQ